MTHTVPTIVATVETPDGRTYRVRQVGPQGYQATVEISPFFEEAINVQPRQYCDCVMSIALHMRAAEQTSGAVAVALAGVIQRGKL